MINSPTNETYALITFEGEEVLDYDVVKLISNASEYKVPMKSLYSPNIFVKLTISTNHEWYQDETEVLVFRFLNVEIKPEKEIYAPGDEAEFEVKTTDQNGNPVKAELSVKGKALPMTIRAAITGRTKGPKVDEICAFLGKGAVIERASEILSII